MARKIVRLTVDHLAALEAPTRDCLFWELDPVRRARVPAHERAAEKEAWLSEVLREWGSCGRVALVDDRPVGYVVYVPAALAPGASALPTAPVSPRRAADDDGVRAARAPRRRPRPDAGAGHGARPDRARRHPGDRGVRRHPRRPRRPRVPSAVRAAGRLPRRRGLQDPTRPRHDAAAADGPALRPHLARRGRAGAGAAAGRRTPGAQPARPVSRGVRRDAGRPSRRRLAEPSSGPAASPTSGRLGDELARAP